MKAPRTVKSDVRYLSDLVHAGIDGLIAARHETDFPAVLIGPFWAATAIGAAAGALTASLSGNRKSRYSVALGGLAGMLLGLGCGVAWASRSFTGALARSAVRNISPVRDAHWLQNNPIDYA